MQIGVRYTVYDVDNESCEKVAIDPDFCRGAVPVTVFTTKTGGQYFNVGFNQEKPLELFQNLTELVPDPPPTLGFKKNSDITLSKIDRVLLFFKFC